MQTASGAYESEWKVTHRGILAANKEQDAEDRSIGTQIHQALLSSVRLELLPKSSIDIFVTIIENDGIEGCVSAGSIAASAALADAGIEMLGLVVSCSAVSLPSD